MNPQLLRVTNRIIERSRETRSAYLARIEQAKTSTVHRSQLACGNLAHGFAACQPEDKASLKSMLRNNIAIITSYNDMLSAHQPYEHYPEIIRKALHEANAVGQVAGGVPAMCDGVTQGQDGMELSLLSREVIAMSAAVGLSHNMFDGALFLGVCDKIVPGLTMAALSFGHLPAVFVPSGPMASGLPNKEKVRIRQLYAEGKVDRMALLESEAASFLCMIAMSPPSDLSADSIRDEKVKVLKSLRRIDRSNVREKTVRGQYTAGFAQGKKVPGYLEEEGANKSSNTETFVAIRVDIDNWRWAGVPFYLRTGKRLPTKCSEVVVYFKTPELNLFKESWQDLPQNKLTIRLQPDEGVDIQVLNKVPGLDHKHNLQITKLDLSYSETFNQTHLADAYERLLLETMRGIQALFVRRDEVEEAWKWVDSITEAWAMDNDAPKPYQAGTWGPVASVAMITRDGRSWNEFE